TNSKHVHARNRGLEEADGDYILLCDDDDIILPGHLRDVLRHAGDADLLYSDVEIVGYKHEPYRRVPISRRLFAYEGSLEQMRRFSTFVSSGALYKRSLHDSIGVFDPEVHNYWDWDFYLRAAAASKVKRVPVAGVL